MNDLTAIARAVDVLEEPQKQPAPRTKTAADRMNRSGNMLTAISFGLLISTALLWSQMAGTP